jgi:hypothetical protein
MRRLEAFFSKIQKQNSKIQNCAAKALFSCPAIISQRLESRIISNEPLENTEEESKIQKFKTYVKRLTSYPMGQSNSPIVPLSDRSNMAKRYLWISVS